MFNSWSPRDVYEAALEGVTVCILDTPSGDDDVLLGDSASCLRDVLAHHELSELPEGWTLREMEQKQAEGFALAWMNMANEDEE